MYVRKRKRVKPRRTWYGGSYDGLLFI